MPPRQSKTARRSASHIDIANSQQANGDAPPELHRPVTDWQNIPENFHGFTVKVDRRDRRQSTTKKAIGKASEGIGDKRKLGDDEDKVKNVQRNPFEGTAIPDIRYTVHPPNMWEDANHYRKFTIANETFAVNDTVFVRASEDQESDSPSIKGWVAKVLAVRAGNEKHVYLRVYWMYRPEDLPMGRQPYHGKNEVIASNDMQIIDATTVDGKASVKHWIEQDDKNELLEPQQLFWRQTLDVSPRLSRNHVLSELPRHCRDNKPCNPDQVLVQCNHCEKWLHDTCLVEDAIRKAYAFHKIPYPGEEDNSEGNQQEIVGSSRRHRSSGSGATSANSSTPISTRQRTNSKRGRPKKSTVDKIAKVINVVQAPSALAFSARVISTENEPTKLEMTDLRQGQKRKKWQKPVTCLICEKEIDAIDSASETGGPVQEAKVEDELSPTSETLLPQTQDEDESLKSESSLSEREKTDSIVKEEAATPNKRSAAAPTDQSSEAIGVAE